MAHELAHVKNRDTLTMTVTATIAGAVAMLANFALFFGDRDRNPIVGLLIMFLAPIAASVVQMAISRSPRIRSRPHWRRDWRRTGSARKRVAED